MNKKTRFACDIIRNHFRDGTKMVDNRNTMKQSAGDHFEDVLEMVGGGFEGGKQ